MRKIYLTTILALLLNWSFAQIWEQNYVADTAFWGGQGLAYEVLQTQDGGYLMAGELDLPTGAIRHYVQLIKTDNQGNEVWRKLLASAYGEIRMDQVNGVHEMSDGGFLVGCNTYYNQQGLYIVRTDMAGDTIWTKIHQASGNQMVTSYSKIANNEFLSLGRSDSTLTLFRTDTSGDLTLQKTIDDYFMPYDIEEMSNGDYIIVGTKNGALHLVRTDTQGDTLWTKTYFYSTGDAATSVQPLSTGDFLVGGYMTGFAGQSASIARYDGNGNEVWQNLIQTLPSATVRVSDMVLDSTGNYLVTGSIAEDFWVATNGGFVAAITPNGQTLWSDTLNNAMNAGGASIISPSNDCYVIAGGSQQGYYLKSNCGTTMTFSRSKLDLNITTAPNPATDFIQFEINHEKLLFFNLKLFDATGRIVRDVNINQQYRLERRNLPTGLYYYGIYDNSQLVGNGKVIFE
ncbi:MAG: T9SS type A sorting domain-containing protein [Saprospiraceae bacterium]